MKHHQPIDYESIKPRLFSSAARLIASSYYDNPAHIYICPEDKARLRQLEWLLGLNLKLQIHHGAQGFCYPENGSVQAMGFWTKPNETNISTLDQILGGLLKVPFKLGWSCFRRAMESSAAIEDQLTRTLGTQQPFLYLNNFVMEKDRRGNGWGSKILEKQFQDIASKNPRAILALCTQRYWTVKFYERHGFEVLLEESIGHGPLAFTNWVMRKK